MSHKLTWKDYLDIAIELEEKYPEVEILQLRFTELHQMVCALEIFEDNPEASNEKILEAIQIAWLEERSF